MKHERPKISDVARIAGVSTACSWNGVKGTGEVIRRPIEVEAFHSVIVDGSLDVEITAMPDVTVIAEGQANILDLLTFEVADGVCRIGTRESYATDKPFVVHIGMPLLRRAELNGSGDVFGKGQLPADELKLVVQGSGDISLEVKARAISATVEGSGDIALKGTCEELDARVTGSGDVDAVGLSCSAAQAEVIGSGDISVNASERLNAAVIGSGDISYRGEPEVTQRVTGSGEVTKR